MKKQIRTVAFGLCLIFLLSSCATVFGGPITDSQKRKPMPDEPKREVRGGFVVLDIVCGVIPLIVDFSNGAIYKQEGKTSNQKVDKN